MGILFSETLDEQKNFMRRCLQLAGGGRGRVSPNPMVGAVLVYKGRIIGEGYHREFGGPHAEVNAIASVKDRSLLRQSVLYVNLEPCSHYGKTPPCAKLIIECGIPEVIIGMEDPYPKVAGRGIGMLQEAGIKVKTGVLEKEAKMLNRRFITFHKKKRPYILLKWAQSSDGFTDRIRKTGEQSDPEKISDTFTSVLSHKTRAEESAILVGTNTVKLDNPRLSTRLWAGKNPVRMFIDRNLKTDRSFHIMDGSVPTVVFNTIKESSEGNLKYIKLNFEGNLITQIIEKTYEMNLQSLIVEGGTALLNSFLENGIWDEIHVEISDKNLFSGIKAPLPKGYVSNSKKYENSTIYEYNNYMIP